MIVQTLTPDHYSVQCAADHDFERFAEQEMASRRQLSYPPFGRVARLLFSGEKKEAVQKRAAEIAGALDPAATAAGGALLGPAPAPLER